MVFQVVHAIEAAIAVRTLPILGLFMDKRMAPVLELGPKPLTTVRVLTDVGFLPSVLCFMHAVLFLTVEGLWAVAAIQTGPLSLHIGGGFSGWSDIRFSRRLVLAALGTPTFFGNRLLLKVRHSGIWHRHLCLHLRLDQCIHTGQGH